MAINLDTTAAPGTAVSPPGSQLPTPKLTDSLDVETRRRIAYALLVILAIIIAVAFFDLLAINDGPPITNAADAIADRKEDAERLMNMTNVLFGPVIALVSSVVGFYFGARTAKEGASG